MPYSALRTVWFENTKYSIWRLVMSELYEVMKFSNLINSWKINKIKFSTFWYVIYVSTTLTTYWLFVDQILNFVDQVYILFQEILFICDIFQISIKYLNMYAPLIFSEFSFFKITKSKKCHFFEENFFFRCLLYHQIFFFFNSFFMKMSAQTSRWC